MSQLALSSLDSSLIEEISSKRNEPNWLKEYRKNYYVKNKDKLMEYQKTYQKTYKDKKNTEKYQKKDRKNIKKKTEKISI